MVTVDELPKDGVEEANEVGFPNEIAFAKGAALVAVVPFTLGAGSKGFALGLSLLVCCSGPFFEVAASIGEESFISSSSESPVINKDSWSE